MTWGGAAMAGEIKFCGPGTGASCYFTIRGSGQAIWSTSGGTGGWESFTSGNYNSYGISATEQGVSNVFVGSFPAAVPAGVYDIVAQRQVGGSFDQMDPRIAQGVEQWNGLKTVPLSDLVTSGQLSLGLPVKLARGQMVQNFGIYLKSAADHVTPFTSGVVSGQIAQGTGSFGPLQSGAFTERGLGFYSVTLTSGDLNTSVARLLFTANGISGGQSDPLPMTFVLQGV